MEEAGMRKRGWVALSRLPCRAGLAGHPVPLSGCWPFEMFHMVELQPCHNPMQST